MTNSHIERLQLLPYEDLMGLVFNYYIKVSGEDKLNTIYNKVMTSDKVSGFISRSRYYSAPPTAMDFLVTINRIPYFYFSKPTTTAIAALMALERWNLEVNPGVDLYTNDDLLHIKAMQILISSKAIEYVH